MTKNNMTSLFVVILCLWGSCVRRARGLIPVPRGPFFSCLIHGLRKVMFSSILLPSADKRQRFIFKLVSSVTLMKCPYLWQTYPP